MKILLLILSIYFTLLSCKHIEDKAKESVTKSVIDKTLKQASVSTTNIERANKNETMVAIAFNEEHLFDKEKRFRTIMNTIGKQMIVFSIDSDDSKINISFSGLKNMLDLKPIVGKNEDGKLEPKDANDTVVTIVMAKENGFAYKLLDGEATILKLSQNEIVIVFSGKAGTFLDANTPENWKPIYGKIICKYPVMNLIQVKKEELIY